MSCSLSIPIVMDTMKVTQMALFKPLTLTHQRRFASVRPLHRRLNSVSVTLTRFRCSSAADDAVIILHVGGMMCDGCVNSVKKILESRPQVLSAHVNLTSETAIVSPSTLPQQPNDLKQLGEELAQHLTTSGFTSTLRDQEDSS